MSAEPRSPERVLSIDTHGAACARPRDEVGALATRAFRPRRALRIASPRSGASRASFVAFLLLFAMLAFGLYVLERTPLEPNGLDALPGDGSAFSEDAEDLRDEELVEEEPRAADDPFAPLAPAPVRAPLADRGQIQGALTVPSGVLTPERWSLVVRPAALSSTPGPDTRRLEFEAGEVVFDVPDLHWGAYEVEPVAPGMNGVVQPVELGPESAWVYVMAVLRPAGELSGRIQNADGSGVADLPLRLVSRTSGVTNEARTDATGAFRFQALPDGEYELHYGAPESPVLEPRSISFRAPSMHLPTDVVEGIGRVTIEVADLRGNPLVGVALTGSGSRGGAIDGATDERGRFEATGLPSGEYRVSAAHPDFQRHLEVFQLPPAGHAHVRFELDAIVR